MWKASASSTQLPDLVTVNGDLAAVPTISAVVDKFGGLRQDRGQHVKVSEAKQMEIPFVIHQEELYKPDQAKFYLVGHRDKEVIDMTFDKLHRQSRMD